MSLELQDRTVPHVFSGGVSVDNLTWWFWVKAGMGFTLGAGVIYIASTILWFYLITQAPALIFLRAFTR